jgi:hypothetical protein
MSRQIVVEIVGDASRFNKGVDQAITKTEGITGKLKGVGKGMVIGAGIGAFNLLTTAIETGVSALGDAYDAFLEDQKGQAMLAQALKNNIPNWDGNTAGAEEYASAQARLGFADDEVRESLGQLVGITHDLTEAQELNTLAQDLARAKGIELSAATDIVTKAHEGNGKALKALGVDIGGAKTAAEMLDAIQKNVTGSAETWAATNSGKVAVSQVKVGEAMEKVGGVVNRFAEILLPALADAFVWISDNVLPPLVDALDWIADNVIPPLSDVITFLTDEVIPPLGDAFEGIGKIVDRVFKVVPAAIKTAINAVIGTVNGIIRAINSISIHVSIPNPLGGEFRLDWNGVNLGYIPYLHTGGVVPGMPGTNVLAMLQAGERVTPAGDGAGVTVVVNGNIYGVSGLDELVGLLAIRLRALGA